MRKNKLSNAIILVVLAVLFILTPLLYPNQSVPFQMMAFMTLAQGINLLYGFTGYLPFGYVGFFGSGAYGVSILVLLLHWSVIPAVIGGGLFAVVVALLLSPLLRLSGAYFSIGSLAASEIVYYVVSNPNMQNITQGPYGINLAGIYDPNTSYYAMLVILLIFTAVVMYVKNSTFGMSLLAIKEDPVSAAMAGINVVRRRVAIWLVSAFAAGLVGAVYGWYVSVFYPSSVFDLTISIFAIVFTLFGGGGTVLGPIVGTIVLYGLYNTIGVSSPQYFQLIYGLLIVVLVMFLPQGLTSLLKRRGINVP